MQSLGITLSFHREMADMARELVGPDLELPLLLRVIHASSKAVSRITRVSGSKDPLPISSMFPPYDRGCQERGLLEPAPERSRMFGSNLAFSGDLFKLRSQKSAGTSRKP